MQKPLLSPNHRGKYLKEFKLDGAMADKELYLIAYRDFENKEVDQGTWIKALTLHEGDKEKARWAYMRMRVEQLERDPQILKSVAASDYSGGIMMWISVIIFIGLTVIAAVFDFMGMEFHWENGLYFLDIPSLLIVVAPAILFGVAATSWKAFGRSWTLPLGSLKKVSLQDARSTSRCLQVMGNTAFIMGVFGTLMGVILILQVLEDSSMLAGASAVTIITLFYGTFFKLLAYVADQRVRNLYLGGSEPLEE
ncbi:MAG TPA: hypothetical protein EYG15_15670 [Deltaproteobacteria bacterium]|jgi:hypothetical protein|nr:hypothetical protein [Candidatus Lambdaproteobacteria bacterium]HIL17508.1 hypothetical protein [Deltaproteobacteria bacterium]